MLTTDATAAPAPERAPARRAPRWAPDAAVVLAATVGALLLRIGPLGPSSLWLDDAWVALVHRADELGEVRHIGFSAPGFVLLLRSWFGAVGFGETTAQLLPLAAGAAAPGLGYLVARRFGWARGPASVAALVLVTSPTAVDYATRVKQYTVESVLALVVLAVGTWLLGDIRSARRWAVFVTLGAIATVMSVFLGLYVGAGIAAGLALAWRQGDGVAARHGLFAGAAAGGLAVAWYSLVLAPAIPTTVTGFWSGHVLVLDEGVGPAVTSVVDAVAGLTGGLAPLPAVVVSAALVAATVAVVRDRPELVVLLGAPTAAAVVAAVLGRAPLGGGRTDIYLYPGLALLLAGGAQALHRAGARHRPSRRWADVAIAMACVALVVAARPAAPYPRQDVSSLVAVLERRAGEGDAVVVYPSSVWAYALYTDDDVEIEPDARNAWGFAPRFGHARTYALPPGRDDPAAYAPTVERLRVAEGRVWLLASHWRDDYADLQRQLGDAGYVRAEVLAAPGAELSRWERS